MTSIDPAAIAARNKASYLSAKAAFNRNDIEACLAYYAADHQIMSRPSPRGREQIAAFFEGSHRSWPGIRIDVEHAVAEGDFVMGRCVTTATHTTTVFGVPPTGKRIEAAFWDLHRFDDQGRIIETWNLMDTFAIMAQMGLVPT